MTRRSDVRDYVGLLLVLAGLAAIAVVGAAMILAGLLAVAIAVFFGLESVAHAIRELGDDE